MGQQVTADNLDQTDRFAAALAQHLPVGTVVVLCGTLGVGKTKLVERIAVHSGVAAEQVSSPTFVICRHYQGNRKIAHVDAYRIADEDEFYELGIDEIASEHDWLFVEWGDRFADCLDDDRLEIHIESVGPTTRTFTLWGRGDFPIENLLHQLEQSGFTG